MFDEPEQPPADRPLNPQDRAREKSDEFRMHAELCAVFEGNRKFDAEILTGLDPGIARECQKIIGRLEKAKFPDTPVIAQERWPDAAALLEMPDAKALSTNDYHIHRRPGEVMILRWLVGEQVDAYYTRLQAHFDAALNGYRQEERQANEWKQDPQMLAYLDALDAVKVKMEERYLRPLLRQHPLFILSTQTADELDITHLADFIMGIPAAEIVGPASAPPDDPTETDRAWFFKLFVLRGRKAAQERIFFFAYLQKSDGF
jgi:hypothetical protein